MGLVYLDHNATTPPAAEVLEAMTRTLRDVTGNPSAVHAEGVAARAAVESAREEVASLLGCAPADVIFTSGGTESDNLAVVGGARARVSDGADPHVVTTNVEHPAVEQACRALEREDFRVTRLPVDRSGLVSADQVAEVLGPATALVSVMHANNETGALMPVAEVAEVCREHGVPLHTDAAQSVGKVPVDVDDLGADLLAVAGHKLYGPRGVGALYRRPGTPLLPFLVGAGHEGGLRPGTENVPAIVGLGRACVLAAAEMEARVRRTRVLRDRLEQRLRSRIPDLVVHGPAQSRLPNTLFVSIPGIDGNALLRELGSEVAASPGAACHSGKSEPSGVLTAMGVDEDLARAALRLSLGRQNDESQIERAAERIAETALGLRADG